MAYTVHFIDMDTDKSQLAHSPTNQALKLYNTKVDQSVKAIDSFQFSIANDHPAAIHIKEMKTLVIIRDAVTHEIEFEGRILNQSSNFSNQLTEKSYKAEDCIAFLHDSKQMPQTLRGKPSDILRFMVNRHNNLVEGYKHFAVGVVEIDTYIAYADEISEVAIVVLRNGDKATIKPTTTTIYDWDGTALPIASYALGVTHTISGERNLNGKRQYQLSRTWPSGVTTVEGFVNEEDIVEATIIVSGGQESGAPPPLGPGVQVKIREGITTYYGASDGGGPKTIPLDYRTFTYTISNHGLTNGMYGLLYQGVHVAWIEAENVVQPDGREFEVIEPGETPPVIKVGGRYPEGTRATIKPGVTTYYWSSDGTGPTTIPQAYRTKTYIVREYSSYYERYAIYTDGYLVAWINESDLDFGAVSRPSRPIDRNKPPFVERTRIIDVELSYKDDTYDAIKEHLLDPYGAEIEWETIEGVRTIHIRERIQQETDEEIRVPLNLITMQRDMDPSDVTTVLIPIGRPPKEERDGED